MTHNTIVDRAQGALVGLAVGDALGAQIEFRDRGTFAPVTDMTGGGPHDLHQGGWTDDTSMALCLAESLIECNGFDPVDQCERYVRWWRDGHWSVKDHCFDIGGATSRALGRFERSRNPFSGGIGKMDAGNGSIMRLAPVPIYYSADLEDVIHYSGESSRTTHSLPSCIDACRLLGAMIATAIAGASREEVLSPNHNISAHLEPNILSIAQGKWREKSYEDIEGSGYVVKSLAAAVWCFANGKDFREAVLLAVNLGDDADTTGAVCGQLAGAFYGYKSIPSEWRGLLIKHDEIVQMATRISATS